MKYVYVLRSIKFKDQRYIGFTSDLKARLKRHNNGECVYTAKYRPWTVETYIGFSDARKARRFERYLKHGSGAAFGRRHF